jgi:hypothetical protein
LTRRIGNLELQLEAYERSDERCQRFERYPAWDH